MLFCWSSSFVDNKNLILPDFSILYQYSTVAAVRFALNVSGRNIFHSNIGGGLNMDHSRVSFEGEMEFRGQHGGAFGGAVRIGELVLVRVLNNCINNMELMIYMCA